MISSSLFQLIYSYTILLECRDQSDPGTSIYDSVQIFINQPPCCGDLVVTSRLAGGTSFALTALNWINSQAGAAPLNHQFFVQPTPLSPFLALADRSPNATSVTQLPPSSSSNGPNITVMVIKESFLGAKANATALVVILGGRTPHVPSW